jgi:hypothetical protein
MPAIHGPQKKREMPAEAGISGRALARVSASGD